MQSKRIRQYIGILAAIAAYYLVHEGAHLVTALSFNAFRQINVMGLGMQIDVYAEHMSDLQMGIFCLVGAAATGIAGWLLVLLAAPICRTKSAAFKAAMWYVSLALLLLDPLYVSLLCGFFGGGDMNGIRLLIPEAAARILFGAIGILNGIAVWKILLPQYKKTFEEESL